MSAIARCMTRCLALFLCVVTAGCRDLDPPTEVVVTNSYLQAAVQECLGHDVEVLRLAEPGMCPGHFDLRPSQARSVAAARWFVRFDFQQTMDAKLPGRPEMTVVPVVVDAGLATPGGYVQACRTIAASLGGSTAALERVVDRMHRLEAAVAHTIDEAGLRGAKVICSRHQARACRALGLEVVAEFAATDQATLGQIDRVIRTGSDGAVRCVIANRPEGARLAQSIADRLGVPCVVFHNFPDIVDGEISFDRMYRRNVQRLIEATSR